MSTTVMSACWPLQMPPTPKAVLISLADNANDHGECWPSIPTIAIRTCFTERSVQRAIGWLESEGLLTADRSNGRHTRYTVTPPTLLPMVKNPRHRVTPDTKSPVTESPKPPSQSREPPSQSPSNRKEPSRTAKKNSAATELDLSSWPSVPSPQVLADWIASRKAKRAPISPTVIKTFGKELAIAASAGVSVDDCLSKCVTRNWQGFEAEWVMPKAANGESHAAPRKLSAVEQVRAANASRQPAAGNAIVDGAARRVG